MNRLVWPILPLLLGAQGCTVVLKPGEAQCETAADCGARGFATAACVEQVCVQPDAAVAVDPVWGCLGNVVEPTPDVTKQVAFPISVVFATSGAPVTWVTVDLCSKIDINCTGSDPKFPKGLKPDADGVLNMSVYQGFDGFVRLSNAPGGPPADAFVDTRVYVGRPIVKPPVTQAVRLFRPTEVDALASLASATVDPTRGTAIFFAVDCQGKPGSKVRFTTKSSDASSIEFYLINQAPTAPPDATETDADGFGGFFNLKTGAAIGTATRSAGNVYVGESSFQVLAGTISFVQIGPTPK